MDVDLLYKKIEDKHNLSITELYISFVNNRPFVTSKIIGATNMEQLKENIESINIKLTDDIISEINFAQEIYPNPAP